MNLIWEEQDWDLILEVLCHVCPLSPYFAFFTGQEGIIVRKSIAVHKLIMYTKNPTADTPTANCLKKEVSLGLPKVGKDKEANLLSSTLQNKAIKLI